MEKLRNHPEPKESMKLLLEKSMREKFITKCELQMQELLKTQRDKKDKKYQDSVNAEVSSKNLNSKKTKATTSKKKSKSKKKVKIQTK